MELDDGNNVKNFGKHVEKVTLSLLWTWVRTLRVSRARRVGTLGVSVSSPGLMIYGRQPTYRAFYLEHFGQKKILCTRR